MAADRARSEKCIVKVVDWLNLKKFEKLKSSLEESLIVVGLREVKEDVVMLLLMEKKLTIEGNVGGFYSCYAH